MPEFDILQVVLIAVFAVLIILMFRNSRKNKARQEELKSQIVPGAAVMTNFGLFGTLISIDELSNVAELEVSPGNIVRVHRQTIAKVVTEDGVAEGEPRSVEEAMEIANREYEASQASATPDAEPEFGERVDTTVEEPAPVKKTTRRPAAKKDSE